MTSAKWRGPAGAAVLFVLCSCTPMRGQFAPTASVASIVLNGDGLSCSTAAGSGAFVVNSWSWGEQNPVTTTGVTGSETGNVSVSNFSITKNFDGCGTALAQLSASGAHLPKVTLQEFDKNNKLVESVILTAAIVVTYQIAGSASSAAPTETVSFSFGTIQITYFTTAGNITFCWDTVKQGTC